MNKTFIVHVARPLDSETVNRLLNCISPEKRERVLKQKIKKQADNMIVGEMLARVAIKKVFGVPLRAQTFCTGAHGKPHLKGHCGIHFSISHSGEYVACAVSDQNIGADIQKISPYNEAVAKRVLTYEQVLEIEQSSDKAAAFTKLWTRNEAYHKLLGTGICSYPDPADSNYKFETQKIQNYYISICYKEK